jgi:hypothetical protein
MDYSNLESRKALDVDIIDTAYIHSDMNTRKIVSAILTSVPDESSFLFSYINNDKADRIDEKVTGSMSLGFSYMAGQAPNAVWLIMNALHIIEELPEGRDILKIILVGLLASLDPDDFDEIIDRVVKHGN